MMNNKILKLLIGFIPLCYSAAAVAAENSQLSSPEPSVVTALTAVMAVWISIAGFLVYIERKVSRLEAELLRRSPAGEKK